MHSHYISLIRYILWNCEHRNMPKDLRQRSKLEHLSFSRYLGKGEVQWVIWNWNMAELLTEIFLNSQMFLMISSVPTRMALKLDKLWRWELNNALLLNSSWGFSNSYMLLNNHCISFAGLKLLAWVNYLVIYFKMLCLYLFWEEGGLEVAWTKKGGFELPAGGGKGRVLRDCTCASSLQKNLCLTLTDINLLPLTSLVVTVSLLRWWFYHCTATSRHTLKLVQPAAINSHAITANWYDGSDWILLTKYCSTLII